MINFKQVVLTNQNPIYSQEAFDATFVNDASTALFEALIKFDEECFNLMESNMYAVHYGITDVSNEILTEGLKDLASGAVEKLKEMGKSISEWFSKVLMTINSHLTDFSTFLKKNDKKLRALDPDFDIEGFEYTIPSDPIDIKPIDKLIEAFNKQVKDIKNIEKADIKEEKEKFDRGDHLDKVRAIVLGEDSPIPLDRFSDSIYKHFRNDSREKDTIHIDKERFNESLDSYKNIVALYKSIKKDGKNIEALINSMCYFFETLTYSYDNGKKKYHASTIAKDENKVNKTETIDYDGNDLAVINELYSFRLYQCKTYKEIIMSVVKGKKDAVESYMKQERKIIRGAISKTNADLSSRGEELNNKDKKEGENKDD